MAQNVEDEEDRAIWEHMSSNIMSDRESEGEGAGKKVVFKRPHWRSAQANDIIERIDEVLKKRREYSSPFSSREVDLTKVHESLIS